MREYPALKQATFPPKSRESRAGIRTNSIQSYFCVYRATISSVRSVDPSLTITHVIGSTVCCTTDCIVSSTYRSSLRAGVIKTYVGRDSFCSPECCGVLCDADLLDP